MRKPNTDAESKLTTDFFDDVNRLMDTIREQENTISRLKAENQILREKYDATLSERIEELKKRNDELMSELNNRRNDHEEI